VFGDLVCRVLYVVQTCCSGILSICLSLGDSHNMML